jgi:regulator of chromosome condensation
VAYETGFAALTEMGDVYTLGDERYAACLGRETSSAHPADEPGLVTALQDLPTGPISKIAAGGYVLAALTAGNDLYVWGGRPGRKTVPGGITDEPTPVDIEGKDIADVAVGEAHMIVLTTSGEIFAIGENGNGQLGLPSKSEETWGRVPVDLKDHRRVVGVHAGARNSFLLVRKEPT